MSSAVDGVAAATFIESEPSGFSEDFPAKNDSYWGLLDESQLSHPHLMIFQGTAMSVRYRILVEGDRTEEEEEEVKELITRTFSDVHGWFSNFSKDSEVSKLNLSGAGVRVPITPQMEQILGLANDCYKWSGGQFDPTVLPLSLLWKEELKRGRVPDESQIEGIKVGWEKVHFGGGVFFKDEEGLTIDLGGIAKGWCVDLLVQRLNAAGFSDVYVDWGSDIRASGQHPDRRDWCTAVVQPPSLGDMFNRWKKVNDGDEVFAKTLATVDLSSKAIATSGDYFQTEKFGYFHVINPKTKRAMQAGPNSIATVSIVADSCALADALATAAMTFPTVDEARKWLEEVQSTIPERLDRFWIFSREGHNLVQSAQAPKQKAQKTLHQSHLRRLMGAIPRPVSVITINCLEFEHQDLGMTATSVSEVEAEGKHLVTFNVMKNALMCQYLSAKSANRFCIHRLSKDQSETAERFAQKNSLSNPANQFEGMKTSRHNNGYLVLDGSFETLHCRITSIRDAGDHILVIALITSRDSAGDKVMLLHQHRTYMDPSKLTRLKKSAIPWSSSVPSPVCLLTALNHSSESQPVGGATTTLNSCSLQPPLVSFVLHKGSKMSEFLNTNPKSSAFSVVLLDKSQDSQGNWFSDPKASMSELFMYVPIDHTWRVPLIPSSSGTLMCRIFDSHDLGDTGHKVIVAKVEFVDASTSGLSPLLVCKSQYFTIKS